VEFAWLQNNKAAHPGKTARLSGKSKGGSFRNINTIVASHSRHARCRSATLVLGLLEMKAQEFFRESPETRSNYKSRPFLRLRE
jgi:hypothetical protein